MDLSITKMIFKNMLLFYIFSFYVRHAFASLYPDYMDVLKILINMILSYKNMHHIIYILCYSLIISSNRKIVP